MYVTAIYGEEQSLKENYNLQFLQSELKNVLEDIEKLKTWAGLITGQIETVKNTKFKHLVRLHRHTRYDKKIEYDVSVWSVPCIENGEKMVCILVYTETFKGVEWNKALVLSERLVVKYGAELKTQGFE